MLGGVRAAALFSEVAWQQPSRQAGRRECVQRMLLAAHPKGSGPGFSVRLRKLCVRWQCLRRCWRWVKRLPRLQGQAVGFGMPCLAQQGGFSGDCLVLMPDSAPCKMERRASASTSVAALAAWHASLHPAFLHVHPPVCPQPLQPQFEVHAGQEHGEQAGGQVG